METYGRYQLLAKLATGGMAQVFLAREEGHERLVVLKRILPHLAENEEFVRMFLQEARVAARLDHAGIARIFDLGKVGDSFFIAMEYIHGDDFRRIMRQANAEGRTLPIPLACRMIAGACDGLEHAHTQGDEHGRPLGIVHRDVSPQNLLVTFEGHVKVIDFGIAKAADSASNTRTGVLKGKYSYMSPEQAEGRRVDRRSDVFALGVVLYELVTQQRLFKRATDLGTIQAVMSCKVPPPSSVNPSVDPELEGIILRVLAKDRDQRTQSAGQLKAELEDYLARHRAPGTVQHLRQFMREIYAERLATESKLGRPIYEEELANKATPSGGSFEFDRNAPGRDAGAADDPTTDSRKGLRPMVPKPATSTETEKLSNPGNVVANATAQHSVQLAPIPRRPAALAGPPPLSPSLLDGEQSVSRVVRASRSRRFLLTTAIVAVIALAGAGGAVALRGGLAPQPPPTARLKVATTPPGAEVFIDDESLGRTPLDVELTPDAPHGLRLVREGFVPITEGVPGFRGELTREYTLKANAVGALQVSTTPAGAAIVLDGHKLERVTPALLTDLDPSREHELAFSLPGYEVEVVKANVRAGAVTPLSRTLKAVAAPVQPVQQVKNVVADPPPAAPREGTLQLVTSPAGIDVEIDGKPAGRTPITGLAIAPGRHDVRFTDAERFLDHATSVTVVAGETARVERTFTPRKVRFNVTPFAKVYIRDREFADSPGDAELIPGTYRVTFSCPDIRAKRTEVITVPPSGEFKVQFALKEGEGYE